MAESAVRYAEQKVDGQGGTSARLSFVRGLTKPKAKEATALGRVR